MFFAPFTGAPAASYAGGQGARDCLSSDTLKKYSVQAAAGISN
jgi:hypothetical protein